MKHLYLLLTILCTAPLASAAWSDTRPLFRPIRFHSEDDDKSRAENCCHARALYSNEFVAPSSMALSELPCPLQNYSIIGRLHKGAPEDQLVACPMMPTTDWELKELKTLIDSGTPLRIDGVVFCYRNCDEEQHRRIRQLLRQRMPQTWRPSPIDEAADDFTKRQVIAQINLELYAIENLSDHLRTHICLFPAAQHLEKERTATLFKLYQLFMHHRRPTELDRYGRPIKRTSEFTSSGSPLPTPVVTQQERAARSAPRTLQREERARRQQERARLPNFPAPYMKYTRGLCTAPCYFKCTPPDFSGM